MDTLHAIELRQPLTHDEAYALAELCKRIGWEDCRALSVDRVECEQMLSAAVKLRQALAAAGFAVR